MATATIVSPPSEHVAATEEACNGDNANGNDDATQQPAAKSSKLFWDDKPDSTVTTNNGTADGKVEPPANGAAGPAGGEGDGAEGVQHLGQFRFVELLNAYAEHKVMFVHVKDKQSDQDGVVILEKKPFSTDDGINAYFAEHAELRLVVKNDIYRNMDLILPKDINEIKATVIYPATAKHIDKYRDQEVFMVTESPEDYQSITAPYVKETGNFSVQWVYNCLDHKAEMERLAFEDPDPATGFMLFPDLKWDGKTRENLYLTALVINRDIGCLRDLRGEHLPLLKNILEKGCKAITDKYSVPANQLRVYIHYQPTYFHLHVHFTYLKYDAPGTSVGKAHLLREVIDNLERDGGHYEKATIQYTIKQSHPLYKLFNDAGKM